MTQSFVLVQKSYLFLCFLACLIIWSPVGQTAPISVKRLTLEQGLSQSTVYAIDQDRSGYIWFGTADGIDIYDGHGFNHLRHDPSSSNSLSDNYVRSLLIDSNGIVWIGTLGGGLNGYNPDTKAWIHYRLSADTTRGLLSDDVYSIFEAADGAIWLGSDAGVSQLDPTEGRFRHYPAAEMNSPATVTAGTIRAITQTGDGFLWFGSASNGVSSFDPISETFRHYRHDNNNSLSISSNAVNVIYEDSRDRLWVGTEYAGLNYLDRSSGRFTRYEQQSGYPEGLNDTEVTSVLEDSDGQLWLGTWSGGLNRFNPDSGSFQHYRSSEANPDSISSDTVISLFEDRSGVLWAGTYDNGVNRIPYQGVDFPHYRYDPLSRDGLADKMIWAFAEDSRGDIWIGSKKGLSRLSGRSAGRDSHLTRSGCNSSLASVDIRSIVADGPWLWLGTAGGGVLKLDPLTCETRQFSFRENDPATLSNNHARLLLIDNDGDLWIGTRNGLNRLDRKTGEIHRFVVDRNDPEALPHARIRALYLDQQGVVRVGTSGGLSRYDRTQNRFYTLTAEQGALSDNDVRSIYRDSDGVLWIATGSGLSRYDPAQKSGRFFYEKDGLSNDTLYSLLADGKYLWITTNNGLSRFDRESFSVDRYDISDGLQSNEFNFNAYLQTRGGSYLIGGVNGFNHFSPARFGSLKTAPELHLRSSIEDSNGKLRSDSDAGSVLPLVMVASDRKVSFIVSVLHYLNPQKNSYQYRLKGYDDNWKSNNADIRRVDYAGLSPGKYSFEVRATGSNGIQSAETISLALRVRPSLWLSSWAIMSYLFVLAGAFWLLLQLITAAYRRREHYLQRLIGENTVELQRRNQRLDEQARELENLMNAQDEFYLRTAHELRTPLALISAPAELLNSKLSAADFNKSTKIILQGTRRLQRLINQMLDAAVSKRIHESGVQTFDLKSLALPIVEAHAARAVHNGVHLTVAAMAEAAITLNRSALEDILHNLIGNAVKYTPAGGHIRVELGLAEKELELLVTDTGMGITSAAQERIFERQFRSQEAASLVAEGDGLGLYTVSQAVSACSGEVTLESTPGKGSRFRVLLPCQSSSSSIVPQEFGSHVEPDSVPVSAEPGAIKPPVVEKLLIVEDDQAMQQVLKMLLGSQYALTFAATVDQGLREARALMPALVLCDVMLPDGSGLDITRTLKNDDMTSHIPVIHLTALGDPDSRIAGLNCSADDYIVKPFSADELKLRISTQIQNRTRQKEWCRRRFLFSADSNSAADSVGVNVADLKFVESLEAVVIELLRKSQCNLDSVAAELHQSGRTIQRKIKTILGCSYTEYAQSQQLKISRDLLENGYSVKEAAYLSGFSDPAHLNRLFKSRYGTTPGQHRRTSCKAAQTRQKAVES